MVNSELKLYELINKPKDIYKSLIDYISEYDKDWSKKLIPASEEKVEEFIKLCKETGFKHEFPKSYISFLKAMGESDGGLLSDRYLGTANIDELMEYYNMYKSEVRELKGNHYELNDGDSELEDKIVFFLNELDQLYFIECKEMKENITTGFAEVEEFSENLEKMLFQTAYYIYENKKTKVNIAFYQIKRKSDEFLKALGYSNIIDLVKEFAGKFGVDELWFSDNRHFYGIKDDISFEVKNTYRPWGAVNGDNEEKTREFALELSEFIGVELSDIDNS